MQTLLTKGRRKCDAARKQTEKNNTVAAEAASVATKSQQSMKTHREKESY